MRSLNVGMIGTRFSGLDGVTLESIKVASVLDGLGHEVSWFAGRLDAEFTPGVEYGPAYFDTADNAAINAAVFGVDDCPPSAIDRIEEAVAAIEGEVASFAAGVDLLLPQNAMAIPMQVPLGVAIARFSKKASHPVLAHHHDFAWERDRFWPNAIPGYLDEAFPAVGEHIRHMVINSIARSDLQTRTGAEALVLPNVMDFERPPPPGDGAAFRGFAGIPSHARVILQPTRMIPRKGIEDTLEVAARLDDMNVVVVVTHPEPDEGVQYVDLLRARATDMGVDFRVVAPEHPVGLADAYAAADLVAYPSRIEGFGNALLETVYFGRPFLVNRYPVFVADIAPTGIQAIEMDGAITDDVVEQARHWLAEPGDWAYTVRANYDICVENFSYSTAARIIRAALDGLL